MEAGVYKESFEVLGDAKDTILADEMSANGSIVKADLRKLSSALS